MPRIMILSFCFPPDVSGGSFNIESIANELSGNSEVLVAVSNWNSIDKSRIRDINKHLKVVQLNHNSVHILIYKVLRKASLICKNDELHWMSELFMAYTCKQALRIANDFKPNCVITACYPFANHIIGREIQKRIGVKWIAYYLDPFFCSENDIFYNMDWAANKEHSVIKKADKVVILRWMAEKYREYSIVPNSILQCIDLPVKRTNGVIKRHDNEFINFVYIGTLYKGLRSPDVLFEFIQKLNEYTSQKIKLVIIGKISGYSMNDVHEWEENYKGFFSHQGVVNHDQLIDYYNKADALISIGNTNKTQMPSKVFEYMGVGKPIIHLSKIDDCPVQKVLEQYPLAICINESEINSLNYNEIGDKILELVQKPILTGKDYESLLKQYTIAEIAKVFR